MKVVVRVRPINRKEEDNIDNYEMFCRGKKKISNKNKVSSHALNFFTKYHHVDPREAITVNKNCVSVCDQEYKNTERKVRDYCFSEVYGT